MDISRAGRWLVDVPLHEGSRLGSSFQMVLKDAEATLRKSALRLRECGQEDGARRADRFAAWSVCGRARSAQLVITDVTTDPAFKPHREVAAASGFRAVQSTPLVDKAGRVVGVVSTHYPRPYAPSARDMLIIRRYADLACQILAASQMPGGSSGA